MEGPLLPLSGKPRGMDGLRGTGNGGSYRLPGGIYSCPTGIPSLPSQSLFRNAFGPRRLIEIISLGPTYLRLRQYQEVDLRQIEDVGKEEGAYRCPENDYGSC